jgi:hypothetical protein
MRGFLSALLLVVVGGMGCDRQQHAAAHSQPDYFAKKRECMELVEKRDRLDGYTWMHASPHQCYAPSLNTCLCEYVGKGDSPYVIDVLTNKMLAPDVPALSATNAMTPEERIRLIGVIQANRHKLLPDEQRAFDAIVQKVGPKNVPGTVANDPSARSGESEGNASRMRYVRERDRLFSLCAQ